MRSRRDIKNCFRALGGEKFVLGLCHRGKFENALRWLIVPGTREIEESKIRRIDSKRRRNVVWKFSRQLNSKYYIYLINGCPGSRTPGQNRTRNCEAAWSAVFSKAIAKQSLFCKGYKSLDTKTKRRRGHRSTNSFPCWPIPSYYK